MRTEIESPEQVDQDLLEAIVGASNGHLKNASDLTSQVVRRRLRETGFRRLALPDKPISDTELVMLPDTELPVVVEMMEPDSPGAKTISFNDTPDVAFYRGDKFVVIFHKLTTPEFVKNIDELRTYKAEIRAIIADNALKDLHTEDDTQFIKYLDRIVGSTSGVGASGLQQNFIINGAITRDTYPEAQNYLEDRSLNNGLWLTNRKTAKAFLKWGRDEIGGDLAEKLFKAGLIGLGESEILGIRHAFTIKRNLVPDNVIYQMAEPAFLGKAYELQPATMYVEKKEDILRFHATAKFGYTIANVAAVNRVAFVP